MLRFPRSIRSLDPVFSSQLPTLRWPHQYCRAYFRRLSIGKKIGLGYGTALAIAMVGSMAGMAWARHHERRAADYAAQIQTQTETIQRLQLDVLQSQLELRSLISYTSQPDKFIATNYRLNRSLKQVDQDLRELAAMTLSGDPELQRLSQLIDEYQSLYDRYQRRIDQFVLDVDQILFQGDPNTLSSSQQLKIATVLLEQFLQKPAVEDFNRLPRKLNPVMRDAQAALEQSQEQLAEVENYSRQVTLWSFALSTCLAAVIAYLINRAVTQPIQQ
ncbi:MAG: hypothetical protein AAFY17_16715, partial [Cyanobacteria bacterium J06642_11]